MWIRKAREKYPRLLGPLDRTGESRQAHREPETAGESLHGLVLRAGELEHAIPRAFPGHRTLSPRTCTVVAGHGDLISGRASPSAAFREARISRMGFGTSRCEDHVQCPSTSADLASTSFPDLYLPRASETVAASVL